MSNSKLKILIFVSAVAAAVAAPLLAADTKTISSVEVQEVDGVTRVILRGAEDPIYTAFMRQDPPRLIVEMPDVTFSGVASPIAAGTALVDEVELGAFGDPRVSLSMARISLGIRGDSDYELIPNGDELVIEVRPTTGVARSESETESVPAAASDLEDATGTDSVAEVVAKIEESLESKAKRELEPKASAPAKVAPSASTFLTSVMATESGAQVQANGAIDNVDSFALDDPPRLVVDFWGVGNRIKLEGQDMTSDKIQKVRVGEHADKVRVVFDLTESGLDHSVAGTANGAVIRLGSAVAENAEGGATESIPAAPADDMVDQIDLEQEATQKQDSLADGSIFDTKAPEQATTDASSSEATEIAATPAAPAAPADGAGVVFGEASVQGVHFESLPATDRVVVTLTNPAETQVVNPDAGTTIVMIRNSKIDSGAERRVDTADFGGPVQHFSVFQTPDVDYDEVRVVLKRGTEGTATLQWAENQLYIEVPRDAVGSTSDWDMPATKTDAATDSSAPSPGAPTQAAGTDTPTESSAAPAEPEFPDPIGGLGEDPFLSGGPADPASIDLLEEGGFSDEKQYTGRRISLDFKDADIGNILRLIAEVSDLNVIAGEEVQGKVTIRLVDVPWDQALDVILLTKGLGFVRVGNVLRIAPLETIKLEAEARLQDRRAKEKLEDLVVKLQPVNYAEVREMKDLVKKLLSKRGTVNTDKRTNTLIIKDIPSVVQEATALIKAIDTATPQVLIESKIIEANLSFSRALGAVWGLGFNPTGRAGSTPSSGGAPDLHLTDTTLAGAPDNILGIDGVPSNFIAANPIGTANNGLLNLGLLGLDDNVQLDLLLEAAESNNKGKVISAPRIVTLDNREASIKQGVAIRFAESTGDKITISFVDAVLELKVTPHITANRSILMNLKVTRNAPSISSATGAVVGIDKNEAATETMVRDGETMVLGGIYVVDSGKNNTKTPFLADIPLLGAAFQSKGVNDVRRELLIFVTPRIIMGAPSAAGL